MFDGLTLAKGKTRPIFFLRLPLQGNGCNIGLDVAVEYVVMVVDESAIRLYKDSGVVLVYRYVIVDLLGGQAAPF